MDKLQDLKAHLIHGAYERRDMWPSRQSASKYFRKRTRWDASVLDSYVVFHSLSLHLEREI